MLFSLQTDNPKLVRHFFRVIFDWYYISIANTTQAVVQAMLIFVIMRR